MELNEKMSPREALNVMPEKEAEEMSCRTKPKESRVRIVGLLVVVG